ncbi:DUF1800 family protein [Amylibacter sp.]|nr:DUF1800 family protein [Amylibacter sp.]
MMNHFKILSFVILMIASSNTYLQANTLTTQIQIMLNELNFNAGPEDGIYGNKTKTAIKRFYQKNENSFDGKLSQNEFDDILSKMPKDFTNEDLILKASINRYKDSFIRNTLNLENYDNEVNQLNTASEKNEKNAQWLQKNMTFEDARHLISRTGIGAHPSEILRLVGLTRSQAISRIVENIDSRNPETETPLFFNKPYPNYWIQGDLDENDQQKFRVARDKEMEELRLWWVSEMLTTQSPAAEKLIMFWHNHFVSSYTGVDENVHLIAKQHWTFRQLGHTNFRALAKAMIKDAAMLEYLDNKQSRKKNPNENLARELLELFVIGEGNYSEKTVKEVARALTGYSSNGLRQDEFRFNHWDHDNGWKVIFDRKGHFDGDDVIDILLNQSETSEFIARKFWKNYVSDFNFNDEEIKKIAKIFKSSDYDIKTLLRSTLSSKSFWEPQNRATIVKSPIDFIIGTIRSTGRLPDTWPSIPNALSTLGQNIFEPPNVAGWPGAGDWIVPSRLLMRRGMLSSLANPPQSENINLSDNMMMNMFSDANMDASEDPNHINNIYLRYAAENFEGPPEYILQAIDKNNKLIWRSDRTKAKGGIDTSLFGENNNQNKNWQIQHFEVPGELNPEFFKLFFLNDRAGPSGTGDRNLFIDWVTIPGKKFLASDGYQSTNCSNANQNPGALYCGGFLKLKIFKNLDGRPNTKKIKAQNYNGLSFERISFDWANDLNKNNNRWANFNISLSKPKFKNIELDAIRISIVRNRDNRGERIFMRLEERNCFPNCIGGPLPRSAFRDNKSKKLSVNYLISGATDHKESKQWYDLSKESKEFVAELVMAIPQMLIEMKKGRHWKNRNGINKFDGWKPVFKQIELRLPKSKYAKTAKNLPIKVHKSKNNNNEMMQMMSDLKSVKTLKMHGRNSSDVSWVNYIGENNAKKPAELFLAQAPVSVSMETLALGEIFSDPVFNLK